MNILLFDHFNRSGGAQEYAVDIASELSNQGHQVFISKIPIETLQHKVANTVKCTEISASPLDTLCNFHRYRKQLQALRLDIIHCNSIPALISAKLLQLSVPVVFTAHDSFLPTHKLRIIKSLATNIIAVSQSVKEYYTSSGYNNSIRVIYNGLQPFEHSSPSCTPIITAIVGRITPTKGIDLFINAANNIALTDSNTEFWIIGEYEDHSYFTHLKSLIKAPDQIFFKPFQSSKQELYSPISILVNCSRYIEPLGRTLIEAGLAHRPVIAPNQGGPLEIVDHLKSGIIFKSGNDDSLIAAMRSLIYNDSLRKTMGAEGYRIATSKFKLETIIQQLVNSYINIIIENGDR